MTAPFTRSFTAAPEHIDVMGHVNNAVWVQWVQDMATAHWQAIATPQQQDELAWIVVRHEIDYRGNIGVGESVTGETYLPVPPRGATFERRVDFCDSANKVLVAANTRWAMIDRASGRLLRIRPHIYEPFMKDTA
ncbi:MAG: acyl-CoA thioesterase [Pontixanthobacter sp.]